MKIISVLDDLYRREHSVCIMGTNIKYISRLHTVAAVLSKLQTVTEPYEELLVADRTIGLYTDMSIKIPPEHDMCDKVVLMSD